MTIAEFVKIGRIKVIPLNPITKAPVMKWKGHPENFTDNINRLREYWKKGNTAFAFIPEKYGLVVLDIDIKHGINGLLNLDHYITDKEISFPYDLYDMPFYTQTPSGGFHFYFKYSGSPLLNTAICKGVEIKHTNLLTAPGSKNKMGKYIAYGNFSNISLIPYTLIRDKVKKKYFYRKPCRQCFQGKKNIPLNTIFKTICRQYGHPLHGNRNIFCFQFAVYAKKKGYSILQTRHYLDNLIGKDFKKEIISTTNSAYKGRG